MARPAIKLTAQRPGSDVAAETAAALAAGSIAFRKSNPTYSHELLRHARGYSSSFLNTTQSTATQFQRPRNSTSLVATRTNLCGVPFGSFSNDMHMPPFATAHTFCASRDVVEKPIFFRPVPTKSLDYFCAVYDCAGKIEISKVRSQKEN